MTWTRHPFLNPLLWSESRLNTLFRPESHKPHGVRVLVSPVGNAKERNESGFKIKLRLLEKGVINNEHANIARQVSWRI